MIMTLSEMKFFSSNKQPMMQEKTSLLQIKDLISLQEDKKVVQTNIRILIRLVKRNLITSQVLTRILNLPKITLVLLSNRKEIQLLSRPFLRINSQLEQVNLRLILSMSLTRIRVQPLDSHLCFIATIWTILISERLRQQLLTMKNSSKRI